MNRKQNNAKRSVNTDRSDRVARELAAQREEWLERFASWPAFRKTA